MPETKPKALLTPEDLRWRAAAWDPDKAERNLKLQYILLGCAIAASIGWGIYFPYRCHLPVGLVESVGDRPLPRQHPSRHCQ